MVNHLETLQPSSRYNFLGVFLQVTVAGHATFVISPHWIGFSFRKNSGFRNGRSASDVQVQKFVHLLLERVLIFVPFGPNPGSLVKRFIYYLNTLVFQVSKTSRKDHRWNKKQFHPYFIGEKLVRGQDLNPLSSNPDSRAPVTLCCGRLCIFLLS